MNYRAGDSFRCIISLERGCVKGTVGVFPEVERIEQ